MNIDKNIWYVTSYPLRVMEVRELGWVGSFQSMCGPQFMYLCVNVGRSHTSWAFANKCHSVVLGQSSCEPHPVYPNNFKLMYCQADSPFVTPITYLHLSLWPFPVTYKDCRQKNVCRHARMPACIDRSMYGRMHACMHWLPTSLFHQYLTLRQRDIHGTSQISY